MVDVFLLAIGAAVSALIAFMGWRLVMLERENTDRWRICVAIFVLGLIATVISMIAGVRSYQQSEETNFRVGQIEEFNRGAMTVEQSDGIARSGPPPDKDFVIEVWASGRFSNLSYQVGGGLHDALVAAKWNSIPLLTREEIIDHPGIVVIARQDSPSLVRLEEILRSVKMPFTTQTNAGLPGAINGGTDAIISVGDTRK